MSVHLTKYTEGKMYLISYLHNLKNVVTSYTSQASFFVSGIYISSHSVIVPYSLASVSLSFV